MSERTSNSKDTILQEQSTHPLPVVGHEPAEIVDGQAGVVASEDGAADGRHLLSEDLIGKVPQFPHPLHHPLLAMGWTIRTVFGLVSLTLLLAIVAAIPIVNFLALGYLLEVEGRMARTGRLRYAFPLLDLAPKLGSIVLGIWLWLWPLRFLASQKNSAHLIDAGSNADVFWHVLTIVVATLVGVHICLALARGGSLGCFFRPIKNVRWLLQRIRDKDYWEHAEHAVGEFVAGLRLKHHFSLGFRGFVGAFAWLFLPTLLFAVLTNTSEPGEVLVTIVGGILLVLVFAWMPYLQVRFAAENRLRAMFEVRAVRELFKRAPFGWLFGVILVYVLALPMNLFKVALPPQDAMWGITIVFIASIYPAKVLLGWTYHRAMMKQKRSWFGFHWMCRTVMLPLLALYVLLLFFTPAIGAHGKVVLFEHHAFLLPWPTFLFE